MAPDELTRLRSKESRKIWIIQQIRCRANKWRQENASYCESADPSFLTSRVSALPEPDRSAFAFFHALPCSVEDSAQILGLGSTAFAEALARARHALAPDLVFPGNAFLRVHRPWGGDHSKVAKAIRSAQSTPEVGTQICADRQWHDTIEQIAIPNDLAFLNLAEPPRPGRLKLLCQPAVLAIGLAFLVVVGVLIYSARTQMDDFIGKDLVMDLVENSLSTTVPDFEPIASTDAGKLDDWFVLNGFENYSVPSQLEQAKAVACRVHKHEGVLMAEVELDKQNARLLVFRAADLKSPVDKSEHIFQQDEWAVAILGDKENRYVVMFQGDTDDMPEFLKTLGK